MKPGEDFGGGSSALAAADRNSGSSTRAGWFTPVRTALLLWFLLMLGLFVARWPAIMAMRLPDPDDAMRLAQVRDLLAGQGWWDLHQYRVNPAGGGVLMHWSRIVDAPIAGLILLLKPLMGQAAAEHLTMASWPPIMASLLFVACALGFRNLPDRRIAHVAPIFLVFCGFTMGQFQPLRIDHHGWQILLATLMLWQAIRPAGVGAGILGGLCGALLLAISIEGLPMVALFAGLAALRWALHGRAADRDRLGGYMGSLAGGSILIQFLTRGPGSLFDSWCDALSAPYLAAFAAAGMATLVVLWLSPRSPWVRFLLLAAAAGLAAASLLWVAPQCASGPFAALDPLVEHYWYRKILEGQPVWRSGTHSVILVLVPSLTGLCGSILAWRGSDNASARRTWTTVIVALLGATLVSLLVLRAVSTAHVYALPGCAWLGIRIWQWARGMRSLLPRVMASAAAALTLPLPGSIVAAWMLGWAFPALLRDQVSKFPVGAIEQTCLNSQAVDQLDHLPPATILTPIDLGGPMVFSTHHSVVATGHHRNKEGMADVLRFFLGDPARSEALVRKHQAALVVICRTAGDLGQYRAERPNGLAAQLYAGRPPAWLVPVPVDGRSGLAVWRVSPR